MATVMSNSDVLAEITSLTNGEGFSESIHNNGTELWIKASPQAILAIDEFLIHVGIIGCKDATTVKVALY